MKKLAKRDMVMRRLRGGDHVRAVHSYLPNRPVRYKARTRIRQRDVRLNLLERGKSLADHLIHLVVAISRQPHDEPDIFQLARQRFRLRSKR